MGNTVYHPTARKIRRYAVVSGSVGLVYMGLLVFTDIILGARPFIAVTIAYASAMLVYFVINKFFIFGSRDRTTAGKELVKFGVVVTVNYIVNQIVVNVMFSFTGEVYSGSIIAGSITIPLSYFVFDRLIFKTSDKGTS
jgi:putative flippase GtrA